MAKYRKKPVVIEAFRLGYDEWPKWARAEIKPGGIVTHTHYCDIPTLEGVMRAKVGDYIIRGVAGEIYPCRDDIFRATYEAVEAD